MSKYAMLESSKPVFDTELPQQLQKTFRELLQDARELVHPDATNTAAEPFYQRLQTEVTAHPVLAQTFSDDARVLSLLDVICRHVHDGSQETIKVLIEAYPQGLIWADRGYYDGAHCAPIQVIAENHRNCGLLVWLVECYPWVFQQKLCQQKPPHLLLMKWYAFGRCDLQTARQFYELYPEGLREKDKAEHMGYPLSLSLIGPEEPDADFVIWMVRQYPDAVYHKLTGGITVLHCACCALAGTHCTPNMAKICRFLISEHVGLVREIVNDVCLPIHVLAHRCNRPIVQEIVILLLKAYPMCTLIRPPEHPGLYAYPFIQHVRPLIVQELEIDQDMPLLSQLLQDLEEAAFMSASQRTSDTSSRLDLFLKVYSSWVALQLNALSEQKQDLQEHVAEICRRLERVDIVLNNEND